MLQTNLCMLQRLSYRLLFVLQRPSLCYGQKLCVLQRPYLRYGQKHFVEQTLCYGQKVFCGTGTLSMLRTEVVLRKLSQKIFLSLHQNPIGDNVTIWSPSNETALMYMIFFFFFETASGFVYFIKVASICAIAMEQGSLV